MHVRAPAAAASSTTGKLRVKAVQIQCHLQQHRMLAFIGLNALEELQAVGGLCLLYLEEFCSGHGRPRVALYGIKAPVSSTLECVTPSCAASKVRLIFEQSAADVQQSYQICMTQHASALCKHSSNLPTCTNER